MISETVLDGVQVGTMGGADRQLKNADQTRRGNKSSNIVAILPRGEAIRNFVYSGVLDEIARDAKVTLVSVVPSDDLETTLRAHCHQFISLREIRESSVVENIREVLDMAHGRWLWSKAAQDRWLVHDLEATGNGDYWKRSIKKIVCRPFATRAGLEMLSKLERVSSRALHTTDEYVRLFKKINPSLVFNGSHVHSRVAIQAVQAAQWLGIPTVAFIFSWDNLTSQGRIIPSYDYYLVWNEGLQTQLLDIYDFVKPEQVIVTGTPQFDFHFRREYRWSRNEFCANVGADPELPIVLYSTGMANHMPGEPLIVERLAAILREMTEFGPPQLLVRVYPKDHTNRFDDVKRRNPDVLFPEIPWERKWLTPRIEDTYLLTNTLGHVALGINIASTVSLELCMFDKPVINVGYNPHGLDISPLDYSRYYDFDHYRPVVQSGAVRVAWSEDEMRLLLRQALSNPQADRSNRRALIESMFGHSLDGYSGTRIAHCLIKLAEMRNFVYA
jgi:hypothetical protein